MVGDILKKRREELGRDLREIADTLKIKYDYLRAIEDGDDKRLPAEVYVRGYLQEYAKVLDIDPEKIIQEFDSQKKPLQPERGGILQQETSKDKRLKIRRFLIPSFIVIVIIVFAIQLLPYLKKSEAPVPPKDTGKAVGKSRVQTQETRKNPSITPDIPSTKETAREGNKEIPAARPATPELSEQSLEVIANDTTWLLVTSDKTNSKEILMKPGETLTWHAKNCFSLRIGNAGGVRLVFNGKEIGKLGEKGQVVNIELPNTRI